MAPNLVRSAAPGILSVVLCVSGAALRAGEVSPTPAIAVSAALSVDGPRTRLDLALSKPVASTAFVLARPDRLVLDLPDTNCQIPASDPQQQVGVVAGMRCGLISSHQSRLVVTLVAPALVASTATGTGPVPGSAVLTVDLARADRAAFDRAVARDAADMALTTGSVPKAALSDLRPLVAIDAGHGGVDPGATAPTGAVEKDITLAFARSLRERLLAGRRCRVLMIRDEDVFVPLGERTRRAREAGADLFISVHADTIAHAGVSGATIYTGSERATDDAAQNLAERENAADGRGAAATSFAGDPVPDILHDITVRETRGFSHRFSGLLLRDMGPVARMSFRPQREAGFRVLRSPDLPAVLVELGYLSNAGDRRRMLSELWRRRTTAGMALAIERFFSAGVASGAALSP